MAVLIREACRGVEHKVHHASPTGAKETTPRTRQESAEAEYRGGVASREGPNVKPKGEML